MTHEIRLASSWPRHAMCPLLVALNVRFPRANRPPWAIAVLRYGVTISRALRQLGYRLGHFFLHREWLRPVPQVCMALARLALHPQTRNHSRRPAPRISLILRDNALESSPVHALRFRTDAVRDSWPPP
jgi:hypothetical protein